ncbi:MULTISPECIES: MFS transporter [unclassified Pseudomonas]|uniref:MFS transporter n=1 Tax=unclassified Pseudomonas TaxID=196821 RepID=UPI0023609D42|nr:MULTISPECIES: MFS transporter [unclassified Pseudomonas]
MFKHSNLCAIQLAACLGFFVVQLDVSVVNVGLAALKHDLHINLTGLQWIINSYALVFSALLILGGGLGDRWGAKIVFAVGFAIFTLGSLGCGLSFDMSSLIITRCIQGLGAALMIPTSLTLLRLNFSDPQKRKTAVAFWGASGGIALAAGPVIGGFMIEHVGWRSVFLINVPLGLIALFLALRFTPASPKVEKHLDLLGLLTSAIAVACLTYALTEGGDAGWTASAPLVSMVIAVIAMASFAVTQQRVASPMLPGHLARNRVLLAMMLTGATINLTFYGVVFVLSIYFQTVLQYDAVHTGLAFIPLTAVMTISSILSAKFGKRTSPLIIMAIGLCLQVIGFLLLSRFTPADSALLFNAALTIVGIGSASTVPAMNNTMLASVTKEDSGIASGLMSSARQVGGVVGVAVFGALISKSDAFGFTQGMATAMFVCIGTLLLCLAVNLQWVPRKQELSPA